MKLKVAMCEAILAIWGVKSVVETLSLGLKKPAGVNSNSKVFQRQESLFMLSVARLEKSKFSVWVKKAQAR